MTRSTKSGREIRIAAVSCHEPNVQLLRDACADQFASVCFTRLASRKHVHDYVATMKQENGSQPPELILLDLETAIEPSWWCVETLGPHLTSEESPFVALADNADHADAESRFGSNVRAVLPIPRNKQQAKGLFKLVASAWVE